MDILLARHVPDDAKGTGLFTGDALHAFAVPRDEGDDALPGASSSRTNASPRPDVPPVIATRSPC